jgi:hypothetical protein
MSEAIRAREAAERLLARPVFPTGTNLPMDVHTVSSYVLAAQAEIERLRKALEEVHGYGLNIVGASEAYGETKSAHLWNEIAAIAEEALWPNRR